MLAPCAIERVIDAESRARLNCRIIAEGANGPTTPEADLVLAERNDAIFVIPDILCNAGGVIVSYFEWVQDLQQYFWAKDEVMDRLERALDRCWAIGGRARANATASPTAPPPWRSASSGCEGQAGARALSVSVGSAMLVRDAGEADMDAVLAIYAHYVLHSLATFEETPPPLDEMRARRRKSIDLGLPYLVAEANGETLGFAYAHSYHPRAPIASRSRIRSTSPSTRTGGGSDRRCSPRSSPAARPARGGR